MQPKATPADMRDLEILERYARGAKPPEIAFAMGISLDTVKAILYRDRLEFPDEPLRSGA